MKKLSINEYDTLRREMLSDLMRERDYDEIDLEVDPLVERYAKPVKEKQASRLLSILDELVMERSGDE